MNGLPYYKAYPRDFIEGTIGMPFEVKCAYRVVLDLIYMQGGNLPDDARYISGLLGCSIRKWKSIRETLVEMDKVQVSGEFLTNYRAEKELETLAKLQDTKRENRAGSSKNKDLQKQPSDHTEPEPEPYIEDARKKASPSRFEDFWEAYPRKVEKKGAKTKFEKAVRDGVDPDRIIAAARVYACSKQVQDGYAKHPTTWLNNGCWDDEVQPAIREIGGKVSDAEAAMNIAAMIRAGVRSRMTPSKVQIAIDAGAITAEECRAAGWGQ